MNCTYAKIINIEQVALISDTVIFNTHQLSRDLVILHDSIDNSILDIQRKMANQKVAYKKRLSKALNELTLQKSELERKIEEVVTSNDYTSGDALQKRITIQIGESRRAYYQVLNDIKDITNSKNYN